jgi:hypothetical protein
MHARAYLITKQVCSENTIVVHGGRYIIFDATASVVIYLEASLGLFPSDPQWEAATRKATHAFPVPQAEKKGGGKAFSFFKTFPSTRSPKRILE